MTHVFAGTNVCIMGGAGSGKTYSIGTLVESDLEVFYMGLESGIESLIKYFTDKKKPVPKNLHWVEVKGGGSTFADIKSSNEQVSRMNFESLLKYADPNRSKHDQYRKVIDSLYNFVDERDGKSYGSVDSWDATRVIVVDGLTGLSNFAMANWMGGKITRDQKDWGIAQNSLEQLLRMLCDGCNCHFVLLAHIERETDPVAGGTKIMMSTLGRALAPKIPAMFSDVILATRNEVSWLWDNRAGNADVKFRNLPYSATNKADFRPLLEQWRINEQAFRTALNPEPKAEPEVAALEKSGSSK